MTQPRTAAPQIIIQGFNDQSARTLPVATEDIPQHLPHFFTYAQKGPLTPQLVVGESLVDLYGAETFNFRGPFVNHNTVFMTEINAEGNAMFVQRFRPADAPDPASLLLAIELLPTLVPQYERTTTGAYKYNTNGELIETGTTVPGFIGQWVIAKSTEDFGEATQRVGTLVDGVTQSTIYPIMELRLPTFGSYGNNTGLRVWAPNIHDQNDPLDDELALEQSSYIFRLQFVERPDSKSSPVVKPTTSGLRYQEFAFNPKALNTRVESELFIDRVAPAAWTDESIGREAPFGDIKVYHQDLDAVLTALYGAERLLSGLPADPEAKFLINIFSAKDMSGNPYHSFVLKGAMDGAPELAETATYYALGGGDGTMSFAAFDEAVREQFLSFGDGDIHYRDMFRFPFSAFYDAGFSLDTKKAMCRVMGVRKDVHLALATQDITQPQNNLAEDSSMAIALRTAARLYPESVVYGTACCRAIVVGDSGYLIGSNYPYLVPGTLEIAKKRAKFAGASNGILKQKQAYDVNPNNLVGYLKGFKNTYRSDTIRNKDWAAGLIYAQSYGMKSDFFAAYQTVFDDDTSVLNDVITMEIAVELNKVCARVWRELTGNAQLTNQQFIERSNERINDYCRDRFAGRVVVEPRTYFSKEDEIRGFSWHCEIHLYASKAKTVAQATVVTHRLEDLRSAA